MIPSASCGGMSAASSDYQYDWIASAAMWERVFSGWLACLIRAMSALGVPWMALLLQDSPAMIACGATRGSCSCSAVCRMLGMKDGLSAVGVGVLDNDPLALRMFRAVLHDRDDIDLLWLASSPAVAVQSCLSAATRPDVLVTDMALEGISGTSVCAKVKQLSGPIRVIGVTAYRTDVYLDDARESGMEAVVSKARLDDLVVRILDEDAAHGGPPTQEENGSGPTPAGRANPSSCEARQSSEQPTPVGGRTLSHRELEVLGCFSRGLNSSETMDRLDITRSTLASYEHRATVKLGARNRTEAVALCIRKHLLP